MRSKLEKQEKELIDKFSREILVCAGLKEKIKAINKAVREIFGNDFEWIGYLLGDQNYVIRDIYIPYQRIDYATVKEDDEKSGVNLVELERTLRSKNLKLLGWIHSHGRMSPFHSGIDDDNTYALVRYIGMQSKKEVLNLDDIPRKYFKIHSRNGDLILESAKSTIIIKLSVPRDLVRILINRKILRASEEKVIANILACLLNYADWWFFKKKWIAPVYSIVTNANLEFYGEVWLFDSEKKPTRLSRGEIVKFVNTCNKGIINYETIINEVSKKMKIL